MQTDVLIIGGGPAGLAAAYEVASRGYKVAIVDESWSLGGQLRQQTQVIDPMPAPFIGLRGFQLAETLVERLKEFRVEYLTKHEFIGLYEDGSAGVSNGKEIAKITPMSLIIATGAAETARTFPGWTLPGVMTIGAAQILMNRERVYPGKNALVLGSSDMALQVTKQMYDVGIEVVGVIEPAPEITARDKKILSDFNESRIPILLNTNVGAVSGKGKVEKALLNIGKEQSVERDYQVDLVCVDGGRHPVLEPFSILNCRLRYERELGGWLPCYDGNLQSSVGGIFIAGQAAGVTCQAGVILTGSIAGLGAVDYLERATTEERESCKQDFWEKLERIELAQVPEVWSARMTHMG